MRLPSRRRSSLGGGESARTQAYRYAENAGRDAKERVDTKVTLPPATQTGRQVHCLRLLRRRSRPADALSRLSTGVGVSRHPRSYIGMLRDAGINQ
jgi:hypothetical protein